MLNTTQSVQESPVEVLSIIGEITLKLCIADHEP